MTQVCRFKKLSPLMQQRIMRRLEENGHSDFEAIAEELQAQGYRISKSSLHRFSQQLRSDAEFLRNWASAQPELAAVLVAALKTSPNGGIKLVLPARRKTGEAK